jgi:anion-transporting  ArsA/GET3 family ATPase
VLAVKGGVGKSTLSVNLAGWLTQQGRTTMLSAHEQAEVAGAGGHHR